ncbi:hypothetical protein B4135_1730 [Caldibacillus debilis]|uniref:Uncharacterized protein n=1 Tax=Caldibacillus debilis TaxID=301148 RepID=A0A150M9C0_9BACI|nr:hypothetical protein B4135_1730 [Caldibacillus debilis]
MRPGCITVLFYGYRSSTDMGEKERFKSERLPTRFFEILSEPTSAGFLRSCQN